MKLVVDTPRIRIYEGLAEHWQGDEVIDFVFTNPYGPIPASLFHKPMIIHQWNHRRQEAEAWCGNRLTYRISAWNNGQEIFWGANIPEPVSLDLQLFKPEPGGWYPETMVRLIFDAYIQRGMTVWDGFMGRGTIAKIAKECGVNYVGVEQLPKHIEIAKVYLGLDQLSIS